MGILEKEIKTKDKRINLKKTILGLIYASGIISIGLIAPNVISAIGMLCKSSKKKKWLKYSINLSFTRLKENGLIETVEFKGKKFARITKKGKEKLNFCQKHNFKLQIPKKWDGRWRIVIFDIKEYRKKIREQLRFTLKEIGFIKLQKSVWIYPYDCEDLISLLKVDFRIGKDILYMIVDKLENDWQLLKNFKLTRK